MDARFSAVLIVVLALAVLIGVVAGRSHMQSAGTPVPTVTTTPVPTPLPRHVSIAPVIAGNAIGFYNPSRLVVRVGQSVTWQNVSSLDHTATADNGAFDTDVLGPGQSYKWTPRKPGTYSYSCFIYPQMHGVVIVKS